MVVVVGGHTRNIGKTSVVAGLIAALPEMHWTAIKITQFGHGICATEGDTCECAVEDLDHPYAVTEEKDRASGTDSSRFLAAGAQRAYWVRTAAGQLGHALPALRRIFDTSGYAIIESNSILQFLRPDLYLAVLDFAAEDFKQTSRTYLDRADAVVLVRHGAERERWSGVARKLWDSKPRFYVQPPQYVTQAMAAWVRGRANSSTTPSRVVTGGTSDSGVRP
jgi:hypothetical protein